MTLNLARLRAVARGETYTETGVSGVTALQSVSVTPPVTSQVIDVTPVTCVTPQNCRVGKTGGESGFDGVSGGVSVPLPPFNSPPAAVIVYDPVAIKRESDRQNAAARRAQISDRWCVCGFMATLAVGAFRAEKGDAGARWLCQECFDRGDG